MKHTLLVVCFIDVHLISYLLYASYYVVMYLMNISGSVMQQCNQWVKRPAMVFISPLELNYGYLALLGP